MLVSNTVYKNKYTGNGITTNFPISFPFLSNAHVAVYRQASSTSDQELVSSTEYTITGAGVESGGTLIMNTAPATGVVLAIVRNCPITQLYEYTELDNFPAESHENALAKVTMVCQELSEELERAVKVEVTSSQTPEDLVAELQTGAEEAAASATAAAASAMSASSYATRAASSATEAASYVNTIRFVNSTVTNATQTTAIVSTGIVSTPTYTPGGATLRVYLDGLLLVKDTHYSEYFTGNKIMALFPVSVGQIWSFEVFLASSSSDIETLVTQAQTAATNAETAETNAETAEAAAVVAQNAAVAAKTDAQSAASSITGLTVSASTLTAGSAATVTYNSATGAMAFGIPRGINGTNGVDGTDGVNGTNGANGADGAAATVVVGTTTTGDPGTSAAVTNSGSDSAAVLNFTIPRGATGATGAAGVDGTNGTNGIDGAAATVSVGTTTTGAAGTYASVVNVGTDSAAVLNFTIPRGADGGGSGGSGGTVTVDVGTTTTGAAGTSASVANSGTTTAAIFDFTIPRGADGTNGTNGTNGADGADGADGAAATVAIGTVTTGAAGSSATVTNSGTTTAAIFDFTIPRGADGTNGTNGTNGADGADGADGAAATISVGTVTTGAAGSSATVTNVGTSSAAVFNFTIPRGDATVTVDTALSSSSTNPVQNKVINTALAAKAIDTSVVHLTGTETISGVKTYSTVLRSNVGVSNPAINTTSDAGGIRIQGGSTLDKCGTVILCGKVYPSLPGYFILRAADASSTADLQGTPAGVLTWGGNNVIRSVNGTTGDTAGNVNIPITIGSTPLTLPSGGTWMLIMLNPTSGGITNADTAAGGTTIPTSLGYTKVLAWQIQR